MVSSVRHGALLTLLVFAAGCGGPPAALTKKTEVITWPALQELQAPSVQQGIVLTAQMGDFAACKKNAAAPEFQALVDKFEAEAIPSSMSSPAREDAKKEVLASYKDLIETAKGSGSPKELKAKVDTLTKSLGKLTDSNLK